MLNENVAVVRELLDESDRISKLANKAFHEKDEFTGNRYSARAGAFYGAAQIVAQKFDLDFRKEQIDWIASKGIDVSHLKGVFE